MRRMRPIGLSVLLVSLTVATGLTISPVPSAAKPVVARSQTVTNLAPGLKLVEITDPSGPYQLKVLEIDPNKPITIDLATPTPMGTYARTSTTASAHQALAAVNGDFSVWPGRSVHPFAEDGGLRELGLQNGASFAISQDETAAHIGHQSMVVKGRNKTSKRKFLVEQWNTDDPVNGQIAGFTNFGGSIAKPPSDACSVRLKTTGKPHWGKANMGVYRDYKVIKRKCGASPLAARHGAIVLSSKQTGKGAATLKAMKRNQIVRLTWSIGWPGVMDSVGGMPWLVDGGVVLAKNCSSYFCSRNPRTGIGIRADGTILLVVVDGRRSSSIGMTLKQFGDYMLSLGATDALNLDGGGSSTMWVKGQGVVNRPTDSSGERAVNNVVLVLPGSDPGEVIPLPYAPRAAMGGAVAVPSDPLASAMSALDARMSADTALADPGSTGGLMDALVSGDLGSTQGLPAGFRRMAAVFRAAR